MARLCFTAGRDVALALEHNPTVKGRRRNQRTHTHTQSWTSIPGSNTAYRDELALLRTSGFAQLSTHPAAHITLPSPPRSPPPTSPLATWYPSTQLPVFNNAEDSYAVLSSNAGDKAKAAGAADANEGCGGDAPATLKEQ